MEADDGYLEYLEDMCLESKNKLMIEICIEVYFCLLFKDLQKWKE